MVEFGVYIANMDFPELREVAQAAENLGYNLIVFPDHLIHERPGGEFDPRGLSYDSLILAAAAIEATRVIKVGHTVLCNLFRHPSLLAQSLTSLDHLSTARVIAGIGAGWTEQEFRMTGINFPPVPVRLKMLDEALTCIRALWTQEKANFEGEFYHLRDAMLWPKPLQLPHPPILVGGSGRGTLRIAAKHADIANIIFETGKPGRLTFENMGKITDEAFREKASFVRDQAAQFGRDPNDIRISNSIFSVTLTQSESATEAAAREIGRSLGVSAEAAVHSPLFLVGTNDQCSSELKRRVAEWGVSQFILSTGNIATMRRLAEEVLRYVS